MCFDPCMPQEITLYTTRQVADLLGVDSSTVRRWALSGKVTPAVTTPGGHMRFSQADLDQLTGSVAPTEAAS